MNATAAWFDIIKEVKPSSVDPLSGKKTFRHGGGKLKDYPSLSQQISSAKEGAGPKDLGVRTLGVSSYAKDRAKAALARRKEPKKVSAKTIRSDEKRKERASRKKKLEEEDVARKKKLSTVARDRRAKTDAARATASEERGVRRKKTLRGVDAFADRVISGKTRPKTKEEARERMAADRKRRKEDKEAGKDYLGQGVRQQERQLLEQSKGPMNMMRRHRLRTGARPVEGVDGPLEGRFQQLGRNWRKVMGKDKGSIQPTLSMRDGYKTNQSLATLPEAERKKSNQKHIDRLQADVDSGKASEQTARLLESMIEERDKEADKTTEAQREKRHQDVTDQNTKLITVLEGLQTALKNQKTTDINTEGT